MTTPFVPDVGGFQAAFPFSKQTSSLLIQSTLLRASRMVSAAVWGDQYLDGIQLLAAHWLTLDPLGTTTALKADATSVYGEQFIAMRRAVVGGGFGVAGGCP